MGAVMVTGTSGSGKTALAAALTAHGELAIDADYTEGLAYWGDEHGVPAPDVRDDADWLTRHSWMWHPARLDELIAAAGDRTLFVCGNASNDRALWDRFDRVVLLVVDEATMLARVADPARENTFGRAPAERALLREWLPGFQADRIARGAVPIDASVPLEDVVAAVLGTRVERPYG